MKIAIQHELQLPKENFEEISTKILSTDTHLIAPDVKKLMVVRKSMETERKEFMDKVKEALVEFDENYKTIDDFLEGDVKQKALDFVKATGVYETKSKMDKEGEVHEVVEFKHELPKGLIYKEGTNKFDYDESKILDDKYYKKTLNKTLVKKAITEGELDKEVMTVTKGAPSISLREDYMEEEVK